MKPIKISATHARNNFFEILDQVSNGKTLIIEKDKKIVAKLVPHIIERQRNKGFMKALMAAAKGFSYNKKDDPLRKKGAGNFLGRWDKSF